MNLNFSLIKESKNLLAFSGGIDSSALFFLLLKKNIPFDLAIVNYNQREEAKDEVLYAKELAKEYDKNLYIFECELQNSNFEKTARDIRYKFFEELIEEHSYNTLITAHQLNDKLEWFLMQLTKGAGLFELIGFNEWENRTTYKIYKPLLEYSKEDLEEYLNKNKLKYFIDKSNFNENYKRNFFRHNFSDKLINNYKNGIKNSFNYLQEDLNSLKLPEAIIEIKELQIYENLKEENLNIRIIDLSLKKRGILLSKKQRDEIIKVKSLVISHKIAISIKDDYIFISPYKNTIMDKKFKEKCRTFKIPKNIRAYLYEEKIDLKSLIR